MRVGSVTFCYPFIQKTLQNWISIMIINTVNALHSFAASSDLTNNWYFKSPLFCPLEDLSIKYYPILFFSDFLWRGNFIFIYSDLLKRVDFHISIYCPTELHSIVVWGTSINDVRQFSEIFDLPTYPFQPLKILFGSFWTPLPTLKLVVVNGRSLRATEVCT